MLAWGTAGLLAGAIGGVAILLAGSFKISLPHWARRGHGIFNFLCLALVVITLLQAKGTVDASAWWGVALLIGALLGGVVFFRILNPSKGRLILGIGHGMFASLGLYLLVPHSGLL